MEIQEIEFESMYYPKRLRQIENPPKKLYVLGNMNILNDKGIAIVGSRDCTDLREPKCQNICCQYCQIWVDCNKWNGKGNRCIST